jgi:ribose transport system permease protein
MLPRSNAETPAEPGSVLVTLPEADTAAMPPGRPARRLLRALSFRRLSAIYILIALFVLFSLWIPGTFLTVGTWRSLLNSQALTALAAVGLVIPMAAGAFDLAVGVEIGLASILVSWLIVDHGVSPGEAIVLTLLAGAAVGTVSAVMTVLVRIDSFIATLGVSSVGTALITWVSGGQQILNLPSQYVSFSTDEFLGVTYLVWMMLVVAAIIWYVLENTPVGRRIYATGGNPESARLAGIRTGAVVAGSLIACSVIAAIVGVLLASQLGAGDPTAGPSYLLPALTAVFLGSTQFRAGRLNVWGTVVAVYVLAVGVTGLQQAGGPTWIPDLFDGVALLLAVGMARYRPNKRLTAVRRMIDVLPRRRPPTEQVPS